MPDQELRSPSTRPPRELQDIILKMPRSVCEASFNKVIEYLKFLRKCSDQQWDNMFELMEMSRECMVGEEETPEAAAAVEQLTSQKSA